MLAEFLVVLAASCPATKIVNQSAEAWNKRDQKSLETAAKRCVVKFPDSPCLTKFIKREPLVYWAICGAKR